MSEDGKEDGKNEAPKTDCPFCGTTIVFPFRDEVPEDEDKHICLMCKGWIENTKTDKSTREFVNHMESCRPKSFEEWKEKRRKSGEPVDGKIEVAFMDDREIERESRRRMRARGTQPNMED